MVGGSQVQRPCACDATCLYEHTSIPSPFLCIYPLDNSNFYDRGKMYILFPTTFIVTTFLDLVRDEFYRTVNRLVSTACALHISFTQDSYQTMILICSCNSTSRRVRNGCEICHVRDVFCSLFLWIDWLTFPDRIKHPV